MAISALDLVGLTAAQLATLQTQALACLSNILVGNQSGSIAGHTFTRAQLGEVTSLISAINSALDRANGVAVDTTYADLSG